MMPTLSVWTIRIALVHLLVGWTVGAGVLAARGGFPMPPFDWLNVHQYVLLFGWTMQLVYGVAYWMLPKFGRERGRTGQAVTAVVLVNAAVVAAVAGSEWGVMYPVAHGCLALSAVSFGIHAWPRIKEFGN